MRTKEQIIAAGFYFHEVAKLRRDRGAADARSALEWALGDPDPVLDTVVPAYLDKYKHEIANAIATEPPNHGET